MAGKRLSEYVSGLTQREVTAFILYNRDRIIAYPNQSANDDVPTSTELPTLEDSGLPIIRQIWTNPNPLNQTNKMVRTQGHWSNVDGNTYAYFYRSVDGYGPGELLVGVAIPSEESRAFRWAALVATAISTGLLVLAVIAAYRVAQRISAPVVQLEDALKKLERMEFDDLKAARVAT